MGLIWVLEIISAVLGLILFKVEVINMKCKNFLPSMFLLLYVPLFCFTPLLYHFLVGGAFTIDHKTKDSIFADVEIYYIYHFYNISMLICFMYATTVFNKFPEAIQSPLPLVTFNQRLLLFIFLLLGIYLYVNSTGLSLLELLVADRFIWFESSDYSPFYSVAASYFISLSPLLFFSVFKG